jgi:hypothetical protein
MVGVLFTATLVLVLPIVEAGVVKSWYEPFSGSPITGTYRKKTWFGNPNEYTKPTVYMSSGNCVMDCGAGVPGLGTALIEQWAGFRGMTYLATSSGYVTVTYTWTLWYYWGIQASGIGAISANTWCYIFGNLYDQTAQAWKLSSDSKTKYWDFTAYPGVGWGEYGNGVVKTVSFTVYLISGHTYEVYTYVKTHCYAQSVGGGSASCRADLAGGQYADLYSIVLSN